LDIKNPNYLNSIDLALADGGCNDIRAHFFIQYTCEQSEQVQAATYDKVSLVTMQIMLIAFFFILLIYYLQTSLSTTSTRFLREISLLS
jgi:hypothetical protein